MPHANDQVHIQGPYRDFASATGSLSPLSVRPGISPVPALPETALALQLPALPLLPPGLQAPAFREVRLEALPVRCTVCLVALVALPDHSVDGWLANSARQVSARHFAATTDEIQCGCNQIFAQIERRGLGGFLRMNRMIVAFPVIAQNRVGVVQGRRSRPAPCLDGLDDEHLVPIIEAQVPTLA